MQDSMSEPQPYFAPLSGGHPAGFTQHDVAEASRVASEEQMVLNAALGRPQIAPPTVLQIRRPFLPDDFRQKVSELDKQISERGIGIDRERFRSLGHERFEKLLAADRKCRAGTMVAGVDLTNFESVQAMLHAFESASVPPRKTIEQATGSAKDRGAVRQISGWADLWKATNERQETLDDLYSFHDQYERLCFGHELLEKLSPDGRAYSPMFRGGKRNVDLFYDWIAAVEGDLVNVKLTGRLWALVSWLTNEKAGPPLPSLLAREFFGVHAPTPMQERIAAATVDGFLLGLDGWPLWDYIGKRTRTAVNESRLASWRGILSKRYPRITEFHTLASGAFFKTVGFGFETHREFDSPACRVFTESTVEKLLDCAGALLALGIDEVFPGAVIARFQTAVLVEDKHKLKDNRIQIGLPLVKAFPGSEFHLDFESVKP